VWARARGAHTRLLGITFMDETLGIYVRDDDPAESVGDLAGRRIGLPRRPGLMFDFWRFAAEKGFRSALRCHEMSWAAVTAVDVIEDPDHGAVSAAGEPAPLRCEYRGQLQALLEGRIDALFGKGPALARLERESRGRMRLLFDVASSPAISDRVNNSTPRLVTAGSRLVDEHREAVVTYLQGLIRAARWAGRHVAETRDIFARECAVDAGAIDRYLAAGYAEKLVPQLDDELMGTVESLKSFLLDHGYLAADFAIGNWTDPEPLREAQSREREEGA
jgi:ABC-type nitrate/sulfonate/bicarbonate transport system substrate-binding protein